MVSELQAVFNELGGEPVLGLSVATDNDLQTAIRKGFPQPVLERVMRSVGITLKELAVSLDLSVRSMRRQRMGRLTAYESDRLYRLARIVVLAKRHIGNDESALRWLKQPNLTLGGRTPLQSIDTEVGALAVENVLGRVAYGGVS